MYKFIPIRKFKSLQGYNNKLKIKIIFDIRKLLCEMFFYEYLIVNMTKLWVVK